MKNFTSYSDKVFEAAVDLHEELIEMEFYEKDCQAKVEPNLAIEFIASRLFEKYTSSGDFDLSVDESLKLLRELMTTIVLESLRHKGLVGSLTSDDEEEVFFLTKAGKEISKAV